MIVPVPMNTLLIRQSKLCGGFLKEVIKKSRKSSHLVLILIQHNKYCIRKDEDLHLRLLDTRKSCSSPHYRVFWKSVHPSFSPHTKIVLHSNYFYLLILTPAVERRCFQRQTGPVLRLALLQPRERQHHEHR